MKLMIDTNKNSVTSVAEKVGITDVVASATRVFLGTAIGMGFIVSAAAFLFLARRVPADDTGGGTNIKPLTVSLIVQATSVVDNQQDFVPVYYKAKAGNTNVLLYSQSDPDTSGAQTQPLASNSAVYIERDATVAAAAPERSPVARWLVPDAKAQATMFSIEPILNGFPTQMIALTYTKSVSAEQTITICIGQTDASRLYIAEDGSTYTDSGFTKRTTAETCDSLKKRTLNFASVADVHGSNGLTPIEHHLNFLQLNNSNLAFYSLANGFQSGSEVINRPIGTPLVITPDFTFGEDYTTPDALLRVTGARYQGQAETVTLCVPSVDVLSEVAPARFFFDSRGNAYTDLLLRQRAITEDCVAMNNRMLRVSDFTDLHVVAGVDPANPSIFNSGHFEFYADQLPLYSLTVDGTGPYYGQAINPIGPLTMQPTTIDLVDAYDVPQTIMHLAGNLRLTSDPNVPPQTFDVTACTPDYAFNANTGENHKVFYFDQHGDAYTDLFLTKRAITTSCQQSYSRGFHITHFNNASLVDGTPGSFVGRLNFNFARNFQFGSMTLPGQELSFSTTTSGTIDPLMIEPVVDGTISTPVTVPYLKIAFQGGYTPDSDVAPTSVSATLCLPSFTFTPSTGSGYKIFYYDTNGNPYSDLLLLNRVACTSGTGGGGGGPSKLPVDSIEP